MLGDDVTSRALGLLDLVDTTDEIPEADIASTSGIGNDALSSALVMYIRYLFWVGVMVGVYPCVCACVRVFVIPNKSVVKFSSCLNI
jgi:hypothetical protein